MAASMTLRDGSAPGGTIVPATEDSTSARMLMYATNALPTRNQLRRVHRGAVVGQNIEWRKIVWLGYAHQPPPPTIPPWPRLLKYSRAIRHTHKHLRRR